MSAAAAYARLRKRARRYRANNADADDLLQDALVAALVAQREPLTDPVDERWLGGVLRKLAAMDARTAQRRRTRERAVVPADAAAPDPVAFEHNVVAAVLAPMAPAARAVATLALHGLGPTDIRWILSLSDTAFRQRLVSVRRALGRLPAALRADALAAALHRPGSPGLDLRLIRTALRTVLARAPGVGTHDPDGHLLVLAHKGAVGGN